MLQCRIDKVAARLVVQVSHARPFRTSKHCNVCLTKTASSHWQNVTSVIIQRNKTVLHPVAICRTKFTDVHQSDKGRRINEAFCFSRHINNVLLPTSHLGSSQVLFQKDSKNSTFSGQSRHFSCLATKPVTGLHGTVVASVWDHSLLLPKIQSCHPARTMAWEPFRNISAPDFPPVALAQSFLENFHVLTFLPWWAAIPLATFFVRSVVTLPLAVYSQIVMDRLKNLEGEKKAMVEELLQEVRRARVEFGWSESQAKTKFKMAMQKHMNALHVRDNCHPYKSTLVMLIQLPLWFSMSFAFRNMAGANIYHKSGGVLSPDLATEGMLWFPNLLLPDTTFILPVTMALTSLAITEINYLKSENPTKLMMGLTYLFRGLSLMFIPIGATVPSCMCYYWVCSTLFGLAQNIAFLYPGVRQRLGLSPEKATSWADLWAKAKVRYSFRRKTKNNNEPKNSEKEEKR